MKKNILNAGILLAGLLFASVQMYADEALEQININVHAGFGFNNCWGNNANCPTTVTVTGTGEKPVFDVTKYKVTPFGEITKEKWVKFGLPIVKNTQKFYSFSPTEGELAGQKIFLLFDNEAQRKGSIYGAQTVIKMYRLIEGQKPYEWLIIGNARISRKPGETPEASFTIKPNGTLLTYDPVRKKLISYELGKKDLSQ